MDTWNAIRPAIDSIIGLPKEKREVIIGEILQVAGVASDYGVTISIETQDILQGITERIPGLLLHEAAFLFMKTVVDTTRVIDELPSNTSIKIEDGHGTILATFTKEDLLPRPTNEGESNA